MLLVKILPHSPHHQSSLFNRNKNMLTKDKVLKGRYRIINQLGHGETSQVYEAYDSIRKANVALKEILIDSEKVPAITERENLKRAFADHAKILAEVKHESLPQVRGYFSEYDRQYLVLELIDGDDADQLLSKNEKPISFADAAHWADQLLDALDYLHTLPAPIVHGDVKPQNIKLTSRGRIKLLGFDITENADAKATLVKSPPTDDELSYLPLEQMLRAADLTDRSGEKIHQEKLDQARKQKADARSDVYALGATVYHLVTGQFAVDALERSLGIWAGEFDPLPKAHELNPAIPTEISDVLTRAMEVEPEKRFGSAMEMRQALQTAVARAKERTTEEAKKQQEAAARETLMAEEKRLEQERLSVEQERVKLEAEQRKQKELLDKQLKAAEAERLKAEQRAAEAEKRLSEEARKAEEAKKAAAAPAAKSAAAKNDSPADKKSAPAKTSSLFSESAPVEKKSSWVMPAVIVVFLLVGAAGAGIWMMRSPNKVEANQTAPTNPATAPVQNQTANPVAEPAPTAEKVSSVTTDQPTAAPVVVEGKPAAQQPVIKNKPAAPAAPAQPKPEKPAPAKPAPTKKAVTVDDLIGGN